GSNPTRPTFSPSAKPEFTRWASERRGFSGGRERVRPDTKRSEHLLHDGYVEPAAELPAHLPLDADEFEADGAVQGDRRLVVADDAGDHRMETSGRCDLDDRLHQRPAHPASPMVGVHVDRVLDGGSVGGTVTEGGQGREPGDLAVDLGDD